MLDVSTIRLIDEHYFWLLIGGLSISCLYFLYSFYRAIVKARTMEDTPTAKIRSAPQGYIEIEGMQRLGPEGLVHAPLSKTPCLWYRYSIEYFSDKRWVTIEQGASSQLFLLDDGTGQCLVDPFGANVTTPEAQGWRGRKRYPQGAPRGIL